MISAFSSRLNGTFFTPPMCQVEQRELPGCIIACLATWTQFSSSDCQRTAFYAARQAVFPLWTRFIASLLDGDFGANFGHFIGDFLGLFFRDGFFDGPGGLVNDGFRLFQTKAGELADDFDDVDFVRANLGKGGVKLGLLFSNGRGLSFGGGGGCWACGGHRGRTYAPLLLERLGQLDQFQYVQLFNFGDNGIYGHGFPFSFMGPYSDCPTTRRTAFYAARQAVGKVLITHVLAVVLHVLE